MVSSTAANDVSIDQLRAEMRGPVLTPGTPGYDDARVIWNAMIDRRPSAIARCMGAADVIAALQFSRENQLPITIRGGGHNVSGNCLADDALMIDLSLMKSIRIDPGARLAQVEPGVLWGEFDQEAQSFGLATVGGTVATTGVAGLTLGGGFGWLTDKHGMTVDNLVSADVVTADGELIYASADENSDLFWGLRGAGANLGIVTSFQYRLHPVGPEILGGMTLYPVDQARDTLRFYREFLADKPDELTSYAAILTTPEGAQVIAIAVCYSGDLAEGQRAVQPIRDFGQPIVDLIRPMPYREQQALITMACPYGRQNYWKSGLSRTLTDDAIDVIAEYAPQTPSPFTVFVLAGNSGAAGRVTPSETAYFHRNAPFNAMILSQWQDPSETERTIGWTRTFFDALQPHLSGGVYVNDLNDPRDEGERRVREAYGDNYDVLVALKTKFDPCNIFRANQNIPPSAQLAQRLESTTV
jgi:FAD/FMN-containing dehydrogenase